MASEYKDLQQPAIIIGGCFALVAVVLSVFLIFQHLRSYNNPAEQKWIVAVIFMVPVYASESVISLWNQRLSFLCDILRSCYEAFALYAFGSYLVACLGGEKRVVELLENEKQKCFGRSQPLVEGSEENQGQRERSCISFLCKPYIIGSYVFTIVKFGLVQYLSVISDDSKDLLCILGILVRAFWGLWRWGIQVALWMTIAAVAHVFIFSTEPYHFVPASDYGRVAAETTKTELKSEEGEKKKLSLLEKKDMQVEAPGTSVTESVQDIVFQGSQSVVKDVVLTINQAIRPVEKGVIKIQETFHRREESSDDREKSELKLEDHVKENLIEIGSDVDLSRKEEK
ncbi:hypothetical protein JCGZ_07505 [Jatropha curcas]|uniref:Uncharacterized protein n=1 Tax=Jatropha curcas TaxID=180498 RepID=A0A067KQ29_JATCU|nr:hypothetical protein JCGZ_07505 [Jatropha curcas]